MNEPGNSPTPEEAGKAAAAVLADDPEMRDLLQRRAQKDKTLTPQQNGKIGAWVRRMLGKSDSPGQPETGAPAVDGSAPTQTQGPGFSDPEFDNAISRRTATSVLSRVEKLLRRKTEAVARRVDPSATEQEIARLGASSGLSADDKILIAELSPDALRELGFNPRKAPLITCGSVLGLWLGQWWLDLEEFERRAIAREQRRQVPAPGAAMRTDEFEVPIRPKGAPPDLRTDPQPPISAKPGPPPIT